MKIFLTAFLQVGLVAINTLLITKLLWVGIFAVSFFISFLWAFNVSKVSVSTTQSKLTYAFGAGCGAITGLLLINLVI